MKKKALMIALFTLVCSFHLFAECLSPQAQVSIVMDGSVSAGVNAAGNSLGFVAGWRDSSNQGAASFSNDNGQTWSSPANFGSGLASFVDITAQDSNFLATWTQGSEGPITVFTSLSPDGTTWEAPVSISTGMGNQHQARTAANSAGFMLVWIRVTGMSILYSSFSPDGTSWGAPVIVPTASQPFHFDIAGNANGFLAAFTNDLATDLGYVSFSNDNGMTWGSQVQVATLANQTRLSVGANSSGFLAAWVEPTMQRIFSSFSTDNGQTWSTPVQVSTGIGDLNTFVSISSNDDVFVVSWISPTNTVQASCSEDNGATWSSPFSFMSSVTPSQSTTLADVAVFQSNTLFTWRDNSNNAISSYSALPLNGGRPSTVSPLFRQVSQTQGGGKLFD